MTFRVCLFGEHLYESLCLPQLNEEFISWQTASLAYACLDSVLSALFSSPLQAADSCASL